MPNEIKIARINQRNSPWVYVANLLARRVDGSPMNPSTNSFQSYGEVLKDKSTISCAAYCDSQPVGYYIVKQENSNEHNLLLVDLLVDPDFRNMGIGHLLVGHIIKTAKSKKSGYVAISEDNPNLDFFKDVVKIPEPTHDCSKLLFEIHYRENKKSE